MAELPIETQCGTGAPAAPPGFQPRIGVRGMLLIAGITMASRRPHKRMKMGGRIGEGMPRMANERLPERSIPDRGPGHAFIAIAHPGWRRHTKL